MNRPAISKKYRDDWHFSGTLVRTDPTTDVEYVRLHGIMQKILTSEVRKQTKWMLNAGRAGLDIVLHQVTHDNPPL